MLAPYGLNGVSQDRQASGALVSRWVGGPPRRLHDWHRAWGIEPETVPGWSAREWWFDRTGSLQWKQAGCSQVVQEVVAVVVVMRFPFRGRQ